MSNQEPGLLTRLIQWIIGLFTGKINDKKKSPNNDWQGGPKATSATVRGTSPSSYTIRGLTAKFQSAVNSPSYTADGGSIKLSLKSGQTTYQSTFSNLALDTGDNTNRTLQSNTVTGNLGSVINSGSSYMMDIELIGNVPGAYSKTSISVQVN